MTRVKPRLFDVRMRDSSRHFADLPKIVSFNAMLDHSKLLEGATESSFVSDGVTEMWLDFEYKGHKFAVNNQMGDYLFFVEEPTCLQPNVIKVAQHSAKVDPR